MVVSFVGWRDNRRCRGASCAAGLFSAMFVSRLLVLGAVGASVWLFLTYDSCAARMIFVTLLCVYFARPKYLFVFLLFLAAFLRVERGALGIMRVQIRHTVLALAGSCFFTWCQRREKTKKLSVTS